MKKPVSPLVHGSLDYGLAVFLVLAVPLFGFTGIAATIFYVVAIAHTALSLMTAYPLGLIKKIPFTAHAKIELAAALFLIAAPWIFGFAEAEIVRNVYLITGAVVVMLWSVTNYRAAESRASSYRYTETHKRMAA